MVKRKNKFTKKALAFASAFIILCSVLIVPCLAQAPDITTNSNSNLTYVNVFIYENNDDVLCFLHVRISNDTYYVYSIDCVFTEYYYNEYYGYVTIDDLLTYYFNITVNSYLLPNNGGPAKSYLDYEIVDCLNEYSNLMISPNGQPINPFNDTIVKNAMSNAIQNQFTYWENEIESAESNGYNNGYDVGSTDGYNEGYNSGFELGRLNGYNEGLSEGESIGYDNGYRVGRSDGYNSGLTQGYTNAINDKDLIADAFFEIFNAPFVFVQQIVPFEIFGINLFHIFAFFLIIALAIFMFKILGKVLPL